MSWRGTAECPKTFMCIQNAHVNIQLLRFCPFFTFPHNVIGWYPWGFLQCLQKKWPVADVRHLFPCISSGLLRPSSENDSQGHVDLSQMSGPGTVGWVRENEGWRRRKTPPPIWGNGSVSPHSSSSPDHVCHTHRTALTCRAPSSQRSSVHEAATHARWRGPDCFSLFEMTYLFITITLQSPQCCLPHPLKMVQTQHRLNVWEGNP